MSNAILLTPIEIPLLYQPFLRKVRAWIKATSPYVKEWTDVEVVCYALAHVAGQIEKGADSASGLAPSSLLHEDEGWIAYCNAMKVDATTQNTGEEENK